MKLTWLFSLIIISTLMFGQDNVILTLNDSKIYKSEFEQIYWKNKKEKIATKEDLDEYIKLFVNFKLKVLAAENYGLDTMKKFINELNGYKVQLEKPYLIDTSINESLIKEAYYRTVNEINASHIMIKLPPNPAPKDTLKAWGKIDSIRKVVLKRGNFEEIAEEISEDPSARFNKGNLGYFNAFKMIYTFEDAAYTTPIGKISNPIRTRYGYHIVKPISLRKARGRVKTAHIMIAIDPNQKKENINAEEKINSIYNKLNNNGSFKELAKEYSDDRNSARKSGELGWISSGGNFYQEFENAVFSLKTDGEISAPFKTPNGWHIVKRLAYETVGEYDKLKYELKNKIQKDARAEKTRTSFIEKLKTEYLLKEELNTNHIQKIITSKNFDIDKYISNKDDKYSNELILKFAENEFTNYDFISYLTRVKAIEQSKSNKKTIVDQFNNFINRELIEYEKTQLTKKHPEFKALLKEYRDGILLFEISDQKIWSKAIKDTSGLNKFYQENKNNWMWSNRIVAEVFTGKDKKEIKKAYSRKKKGINLGEYTKTTLDSFDDYNTTYETLKKGLNKPIFINGQWIFINVLEKLPARPKYLGEAEGLIVSAYQNYLEQEWLENLKKENKIEVNYDILYSIKEKP
jgi:peptidyl-prolyl cis-trans isomerase SurA